MNATSRNLTDANLIETVPYEPYHDKGRVHDRPQGSPAMPTPPGQHRYTFNSGAKPLDGYTVKRAIGRGGFGEVYYATSDAGKEVALKLILHNLDVERRGVAQCMNLKCPNLLTIHDLKTAESGDTFVVMEYVAGPSLANVLARNPNGLPEPEVRAWLKGLVEGVAYLHDHGIVHRDLKPANVFMEEGIVKIGDYGLAKLMTPGQGSEHSESIGTCHYMAPEIASGKYHKPIDVYAMGIILFEMLTGRVPFEGESVGEVLMKHLTARPDLSPLSEPYRTIVGRALAKDPNHRPANVHELLPPEDAPKPLNIRFIGDAQPARPPAPEPEDILRIGPEEPVFYIGPETRPSADRNRNGRGRRPPQPQPQAQPQPRSRRVARFVAQRTTPVAPPPEPPPLPSGRVRLAELASALLVATPLTAVLLVPATALLDIDPVARPQEIANLGTVTLLGVWGVLGLNKLLEGRRVEPVKRRFLQLIVGLLVGVVGLVLSLWLRGAATTAWVSEFTHWGSWTDLTNDASEPLRTLAFFGLAFLANGWWKLTERDRKARFRVLPTLAAAAIGTIMQTLWLHQRPYGIAVIAVMAIVVQLVSPWSSAAATYARYASKYKIKNPNIV